MWGSTIGAVSMGSDTDHAVFQYDPNFVKSGIEVSPITMPLNPEPYALS